jgi:hypothetical protein
MRCYSVRKGYRPRADWGDGLLPAPYSEGDLLDVPASAPGFAGPRPRIDNGPPGLFRVIAACSVGEGDEWYFRVSAVSETRTDWARVSGRLYVTPTVDHLAGATVVDCADPDGLRERKRLLSSDDGTLLLTARQFNQVADALCDRTMFMSVFPERTMRTIPEYVQIVDAGRRVLPFLGERMRRDPYALWLLIAGQISGGTPDAVMEHMPVEDGFVKVSVQDACRAWADVLAPQSADS